MEPTPPQEVTADTAIGKFAFKGSSLNTLATVATLILTCVIAYVLYLHQQDSREAGNAFVGAIKEQTLAVKEQTVAAREQNCLMRFEMRERAERAEFCKQIAR